MAEIDYSKVSPDMGKDEKTWKRFIPITDEGRKYYMSPYESVLDKMLRVTLYPATSAAKYEAQKLTGKQTDQGSLVGAVAAGFSGKSKTFGSDVMGELLPNEIGEAPFTPAFWTKFEGVPESIQNAGIKFEEIYAKLTPDVKTKTVTGMPLDYALDWTSYLGWNSAGQTAKLAKALKIREVAARVALATSKIPYMGEIGKTARDAGRVLLTDPLFHSKGVAQLDLIISRAKKLGVADDIIMAAQKGIVDPGMAAEELANAVAKANSLRLRKSVINAATRSAIDYDTITKEAMFTRNALAKGVDEVKGLDALREVERKGSIARLRGFKTAEDEYFRLQGTLHAVSAKAKDEIRPMMRAWKRLEKTNPEAYEALRDAFEDAIPIPRNGKWGFSDKFYDDLRRVGLTDEKIAEIQASVLRPDAPSIPMEALEHLKDLGATEEGALNALGGGEYILPWELPEYDKAVSVALENISPNAKYAYQKAIEIKKSLVNEMIKNRWMDRQEIARFAQQTGLNHILHDIKPKAMKSVDNYGLNLRKDWIGKIDEQMPNIPEGKDVNLNSVRQIRNTLETGKVDDLLKHDEWFEKSINELDKVIKSNRLFSQAQAGAVRLRELITDIKSRRQILGSISEIHGILGRQIFEEDFTKIILRENIRTKTAIRLQNYVNNVSKAFPELLKPIKKVPDKIPPGFSVFTDTGTGKMFLVNNDFSPAFKARFQLANNTDGFTRKVLAGLNGIYSEMNQTFKYTVTVPFIAFIERNFVSSIAIAAQAGLEAPNDLVKYYKKAGEFYSKLWSGDPKARKLYYEFIKEYIARGGFSRIEAFEKSGRVVGAIKKVPVVGKYLTAMEAATELGDDLPKVALYFYAKDVGPQHWLKYGTFKNAYEFVRKMMPVYSPGTQFESKYLQNFLPFYRFDRYNIPLNVEMMARNPRFYLNIEKIRREATIGLGGEQEQDWMPDYIKGGYPVGIRPTKGGTYRYFMLRGWLANPSLNDVLDASGWKDQFMQRVTPYAKLPVEMATNKSFFTGKKIERAPGETEEIVGVRMRKKYTNLLRSIRLVNTIDKLFFPKYEESPTQRAIKAFVGNIYTIDEDKTKNRIIQIIDLQINSLKGERDLLLENGDDKAAEKIQNAIEKLYEEKGNI